MLCLTVIVLFYFLILQDNRMNHLKIKVDSLNYSEQRQSNDIHMYFWNGIRKVFCAYPLFLCAVVYRVN